MHSTEDVMRHESNYIVHPATLDGCLQLSFVAAQHADTSRGRRAYLPFEVKTMTVWDGGATTEDFAFIEGEGSVRGLRSVESSFKVVSPSGSPIVEAEVIFRSAEGLFAAAKEEIDPQPYQRLKWLPDIDMLHGSTSKETFLNRGGDALLKDSMDSKQDGKDFLLRLRSLVNGTRPDMDISKWEAESSRWSLRAILYMESLMCLHKLVELIAFKDPGLRILEIGGDCGLTSAAILSAAGGKSTYPAYSSYTFAGSGIEVAETVHARFKTCKNVRGWHVDLYDDVAFQDFSERSVDLLVVTDLPSMTADVRDVLKRLIPLLAPGGRFIVFNKLTDLELEEAFFGTRKGSEKHVSNALSEGGADIDWQETLVEAGLSGVQLDIGKGVVLLSAARQLESQNSLQEGLSRTKPMHELWLLHRQLHPLIEAVELVTAQRDIQIHRLHISNAAALPKGVRVLMLAEVEESLLSQLTTSEVAAVQALFALSSSIIWITCGQDPELSLIHGMAKVVKTEYPSLQLSCIDLESHSSDWTSSAELVLRHEIYSQEDSKDTFETHVVERNSATHISRYVIDEEENLNDLCQTKPVITKGNFVAGLQLDMLHVGQVGSHFFTANQTTLLRGDHVPSGQVVVSPRLYGLSLSHLSIWVLLADIQNAGRYDVERTKLLKLIQPRMLGYDYASSSRFEVQAR
jgi:Polyketide synthase dehydratase